MPRCHTVRAIVCQLSRDGWMDIRADYELATRVVRGRRWACARAKATFFMALEDRSSSQIPECDPPRSSCTALHHPPFFLVLRKCDRRAAPLPISPASQPHPRVLALLPHASSCGLLQLTWSRVELHPRSPLAPACQHPPARCAPVCAPLAIVPHG
ncbi:hypothetical protein B0H10DRAFT_1976083 [Mycena sp. CBHHK59/15]|nr:hypothetical protein B0H10DRAFT_1976083 [Mycena sp. CBHHK59/15]